MRSTFDGERAFSCPFCEDTGMVDVWMPTVMCWFYEKYFLSGAGVPEKWYLTPEVIEARSQAVFTPFFSHRPMRLGMDSCVVACKCAYGEKYARQVDKSGKLFHQVYEAQKYCRYRHGEPSHLMKWLEEVTELKRAAYADFNEFNNRGQQFAQEWK